MSPRLPERSSNVTAAKEFVQHNFCKCICKYSRHRALCSDDRRRIVLQKDANQATRNRGKQVCRLAHVEKDDGAPSLKEFLALEFAFLDFRSSDVDPRLVAHLRCQGK